MTLEGVKNKEVDLGNDNFKTRFGYELLSPADITEESFFPFES